ncbi:hypothetical protein JAAARDRAFT_206574 [Jaapia argillacea MUCL 33604]|uniref:Nephrocystin 3-like N-terminal domain-containing protein n=1 Tax=Jaapia argillacea MUCL 33604 TaxID=933084 RepID=A0A067PV63_9AGAM|nr:hypothetical protein JAAARDRAFT_206574 [Jaapia argillacea MUCL 33604]
MTTPSRARAQTAIGGVDLVLQALRSLTGLIPVPGLNVALKGLQVVLNGIDGALYNADDLEELAHFISTWEQVLKDADPGEDDGWQTLKHRVDRFCAALDPVEKEVQKLGGNNFVFRVIRNKMDKKVMIRLRTTIQDAVKTFIVEGEIAREYAVQLLRHEMSEVQRELSDIRDNLNEVGLSVVTLQDPNWPLPPFAGAALYNSQWGESIGREGCLPNTRAQILKLIQSWAGYLPGDATATNIESPNEGDRRILWINGVMGAGKTSIAYSAADQFKADSVLGATFFCNRDNLLSRSAVRIFHSISHQLCQAYDGYYHQSGFSNYHGVSPFHRVVSNALKKDLTIVHLKALKQLDDLIVNPLTHTRSEGHIRPFVIVLDAIDECEGAAHILDALSERATELSPLKFLITGRPEGKISSYFQKGGKLGGVAGTIVLDGTEDGVHEDIQYYLRGRLNTSPSPEVVQQDVSKVANLAGGLFIFARIFADHLGSNAVSRDVANLIQAMRFETSSEPRKKLNTLYQQVLETALQKISPQSSRPLRISPQLSRPLRTTLVSLTVLQDSLSPFSLDKLLSFPPDTVHRALAPLGSVVSVPGIHEDQPIHLIHPSFADFVASKSCRKLVPEFAIDRQIGHTILLHRCLITMQGLTRNTSSITDPGVLNGEMDDLERRRIQQSIKEHIRYACFHWATHLSRCLITDDILADLNSFCSRDLLHWIEVCSSFGPYALYHAIKSLKLAQHVLKCGRDRAPDIVTKLLDCERLIVTFFPALCASPLQIYYSALPFIPRQSSLYKSYRSHPDFSETVIVKCGSVDHWSSDLKVMEAHSSEVVALKFSDDGGHIISASASDACLWNSITGNLVEDDTETVNGQSRALDADQHRIANLNTAIALSAFSTRIIGFDHKNILDHGHVLRLVDSALGQSPDVPRVPVCSMALSNGCNLFALGFGNGTVQVWNNRTHLPGGSFTMHSGAVRTISFSDHGSHFISGSDDMSAAVGEMGLIKRRVHLLKGHSRLVSSVAISPKFTHSPNPVSLFVDKGDQLALSASWDSTVRVWDIVTGVCLRTLKGHGGEVNSAVFSPSGRYIITGSNDKTVRIWDAYNGTVLNTFWGHNDRVTAVASSPHTALPFGTLTSASPYSDIFQIASGSADTTIRLWDISRPSSKQLEECRFATSVQFSPDNRLIVFTSRSSHDVYCWSREQLTEVSIFRGHSSEVDAVAVAQFPPGGPIYILSGSFDTTIRLWSPGMGYISTFEGHTRCVSAITFFPSQTTNVNRTTKDVLSAVRFVSGSWDYSVRFWDGNKLQLIGHHTGHVTSVAVSPDGNQIVSGSDDNTVRVWSWDDRLSNFTLQFTGRTRSIHSVSFTPDGRRIVAAERSGIIKVWDSTDWSLIARTKPVWMEYDKLERGDTSVTGLDGEPFQAWGFTTSSNRYQSGLVDISHPSWPVYSLEDGWILEANPGTARKRLCWLPVNLRCLQASTGSYVILANARGGMVILDFHRYRACHTHLPRANYPQLPQLQEVRGVQ